MLSVRGNRELEAAVLALNGADRDIRQEVDRRTRVPMSDVWRDLVEKGAHGARDLPLLGKGARIKPGNPPRAIAAASTKAMSGGLVPADDWRGFEFGGDRSRVTTYTGRSPLGRTFPVTRHTMRQMPPRYRGGRVVYPAFKTFAPRLATIWVHTIVRTMRDRLEGKY